MQRSAKRQLTIFQFLKGRHSGLLGGPNNRFLLYNLLLLWLFLPFPFTFLLCAQCRPDCVVSHPLGSHVRVRQLGGCLSLPLVSTCAQCVVVKIEDILTKHPLHRSCRSTVDFMFCHPRLYSNRRCPSQLSTSLNDRGSSRLPSSLYEQLRHLLQGKIMKITRQY
jgi:hypothetical protein